jgi:hypothetical protein
MTRRFAPAAVGTAAGSLLVAASGLASPIVAFAGVAGVTVVALILAFPYWGFLLTAAVVPMERIGRLTDDASLATISLMRIVGTLALGALLLHALLRRRRLIISTPGLVYAAYFAVGVVTLTFTSDFEFGVRASSSIFDNVLFFVLVVNSVKTGAHARAAVICWLLTTAAVGVFTVYQWHNGAVITEEMDNATGQRTADQRYSTVLSDISEYQVLRETPRALGTSSHPAVYAINLILTLPFFAYFYRITKRPLWRVAIAAAAAVTAYNVMLANTRAAIICMLVVMVLIVTMRLIRVTAAGLAAGVLLCVLAVPFVPSALWSRVLDVSNYTLDRSDTLRARLTYWRESLDMLSDNLPLGIGIGNQSELPRRLSTRMYMPPNSTVHNEYLQSLLETGLIGYALLIAFMVLLYRYARQGERLLLRDGERDDALLLRACRIALLSVLIYGLQVDVMHFPLKGWWLAMGIAVALYTQRVAARPLARAA